MIQLLSSILFLAAAIIVIIVVATTERAEAQFGFVYDHDKRTLDFCTPYALHIGTVVRYLERADNGGIIENDTALVRVSWATLNGNAKMQVPLIVRRVLTHDILIG